MDLLFIDLPYGTFEFGESFLSITKRKYLKPHEIALAFRHLVPFIRRNGYLADVAFLTPDINDIQLIEQIKKINPLILGFTTYEGNLNTTLHFIKELKKKGVKSFICLGGQTATYYCEDVLNKYSNLIDAIILGEGEYSLLELIGQIKNGRNIGNLPGIAYKNGKVVINKERPLIENLDLLPFPNLWDKWENGNYFKRSLSPLFLSSSRGCYGNCAFCRTPEMCGGWRAKSPKRIIDEIEEAYKKGVRLFEFVDDNFLGPGVKGKRRAEAIASEILSRNLKVKFHFSCRVNDIDEGTIKLLKDAGLTSVSIGVESGVQRILNEFNKGITVGQSKKAVELLDKLGIKTKVFIIYFEPYMTLKEAKENLSFLCSLRNYKNVDFEDIIFRKLIPLGGTIIWEKIKKDKLLQGNYITGYSFKFVDKKVAALSHFMEMLDLRFETFYGVIKAKLSSEFYRWFKTEFEFDLAEKVIYELESNDNSDGAAAFNGLNKLLDQELKRFPIAPSNAKERR